MKRLTILLGLVSGFVVSGCAVAAPGIVTGGIYSGYTIGSSVGPGTGTKTGEACAMSILGVVAIGDASIDAAKQAGGIAQVASVDHHSFSILGIYGTLCTEVKGQ
jgi:hypothetical protein